MNNADDPSLDLSQFFPSCTHGDILITTRNCDLSLLASGGHSNYSVLGMSSMDAIQLLVKTAWLEDSQISGDQEAAVASLVKVQIRSRLSSIGPHDYTPVF
jgi:hypothetical protein